MTSVLPSFATLALIVAKMIAAGSSLPPAKIRLANNDSWSPQGSYCSFLRISSFQEGTTQHSFNPDTEEAVSQSTMCAVWSIQFIRDKTFSLAQSFHHWIQSEEGIRTLASHGLTFRGVSDIRDISRIYNEQWEAITNLDLDVSYSETMTKTSRSIVSIPLAVNTSEVQINAD